MTGEVKSKLKDLWINFHNETSIHGLRYLVGKSHKNFGTRIIWFLSFGFALILLVFNLYKNLDAFMSYDYETKTSLSFVSQMQFPAVSLCNAHSFDKRKVDKSDILYQYLEEKFTPIYRSVDFIDSKWNQSEVRLSDLDAMLFSPEDIVSIAQIQNRNLDISTHFKTSYRTHLRSCLTLNNHWFEDSPEPMTLGMNEEIRFYIKIHQDDYAFFSPEASMSVIIHSPDEPLDVHSPRAVLSPGNSYELLLSTRKYSYLPHPYNSYQGIDCENLENMKNLKYFRRYTYRGCLLECLSDYVFNICGCITEYIVYNRTDVPYCTPLQREGCVLSITKQFYSSNYNYSCVCPRPCSETKYDIELSAGLFPSSGALDYLIVRNLTHSLEHARNNLLKVVVSFKDSMIAHVYHEPKMSISDTVSIIGGFMGFFLGASILSVMEFLETIFWCVITVITSFIKQKKEENSKQTRVVAFK